MNVTGARWEHEGTQTSAAGFTLLPSDVWMSLLCARSVLRACLLSWWIPTAIHDAARTPSYLPLCARDWRMDLSEGPFCTGGCACRVLICAAGLASAVVPPGFGANSVRSRAPCLRLRGRQRSDLRSAL